MIKELIERHFHDSILGWFKIININNRKSNVLVNLNTTRQRRWWMMIEWQLRMFIFCRNSWCIKYEWTSVELGEYGPPYVCSVSFSCHNWMNWNQRVCSTHQNQHFGAGISGTPNFAIWLFSLSASSEGEHSATKQLSPGVLYSSE